MESIQLIAAKQSEVEAIRQLIMAANLDDVALSHHEFMLLKKQDTIIGLGRIRQHAGISELCSLAIDEKWRNRGLGKRLINALVEPLDQKVYAVTEIPDYFAKSGFVVQEQYPEVLNEKLQRCVSCYNCNAPVVMVLQQIKEN